MAATTITRGKVGTLQPRLKPPDWRGGKLKTESSCVHGNIQSKGCNNVYFITVVHDPVNH